MIALLEHLARWSDRRTPWLVLAAGALALELAALYFQHVEGLDPCVLCVYERVAVSGILVAGLLAALAPWQPLLRGAAFVLWGLSAGWGLALALEHVGIQFSDELDFSCSFFADFPSWAPLDAWWPAVFQPTGTCDEIQWQFVGLSMPQWMLVIYALYLIVWLTVVIGFWVPGRRAARRSHS